MQSTNKIHELREHVLVWVVKWLIKGVEHYSLDITKERDLTAFENPANRRKVVVRVKGDHYLLHFIGQQPGDVGYFTREVSFDLPPLYVAEMIRSFTRSDDSFSEFKGFLDNLDPCEFDTL